MTAMLDITKLDSNKLDVQALRDAADGAGA
jgi:hypothetical protein